MTASDAIHPPRPCIFALDETSPSSMTILYAYPWTTTLVMLLNAVLLSPCFPILLNVDVIIGLEVVDGLIGKFDTMGSSASNSKH